MKDLNSGEQFSFKVNQWMWRNEGDCDVWRELPVVRPGESPLPGESPALSQPALTQYLQYI